MQKIRLAMLAWEIGRVSTGFGVKAGGLGSVMEELPAELLKYAEEEEIELEVELLSPCFGHYDRKRMHNTGLSLPVVVDGNKFDFSAGNDLSI